MNRRPFNHEYRTQEQIKEVCTQSFNALKVPARFKFECWDRVPISDSEPEEIQSRGATFLDTATSGFGITRYRIFFHTYTERMGLVRLTEQFGVGGQQCLASNITPEEVNQLLEKL